ncbi:hypothetical protein BON30_05905 [Cystobacter ferrugineus]|uniref:Uncharacterized protein n=1 Tax=Cystobacter ferrugineus TaxID=83449 RepID=A0A1L9BK84_9BACT|nr:hypothetical protein BON30_05905 [Cystobacter ferrugineus]
MPSDRISSSGSPHIRTTSPASSPRSNSPTQQAPQNVPAAPDLSALLNLPSVPTTGTESPPRDAFTSQPSEAQLFARLTALSAPTTHTPTRSNVYSTSSSPRNSASSSPTQGYEDLAARLERLRLPRTSSPPSTQQLSLNDLWKINDQKLGIRSGENATDARNAAYSLAAPLQREHFLRGMDESAQAQWANDLRGSIRKMLDSPDAEGRHLILATRVGSDPNAESYNAPGNLKTFPKGQVTGQALATIPLAGKSEGELVDWVMNQIKEG